MLNIFNLKEKEEYIYEVAKLTYLEWGEKTNLEIQEEKIQTKINKIKNRFNTENYCKLILLDNDELVGFISIFPNDCEERKELFPWYATMYVKKEYRGKGYSKILNNAILKEAKERNIKRLYLKTDLNNYYEKFGAKYMEKLQNGEKIYYFDL